MCTGAATTVVECNDRSSEPWDAVGRSCIMHRNVRLLPALIRAFDRMERIRAECGFIVLLSLKMNNESKEKVRN